MRNTLFAQVIFTEEFTNTNPTINRSASHIGWNSYVGTTATDISTVDPVAGADRLGVFNQNGSPNTSVGALFTVNQFIASQTFSAVKTNLSLVAPTQFTWNMGNGATDASARILIQIGSNWYVSTTAHSSGSVFSLAAFQTSAENESITSSGTTWQNFTLIPNVGMSIGGVASIDPAQSLITGVGLFIQSSATLGIIHRLDTLQISNAGSSTISSAITGTTSITQSTANTTLTLTSNNSSTGTATVSNGTLVIGTEAGGNWAGNVVVNGGTLNGRGQITGSLTLNGGVYSPGNSPGIQNVGTFTVNAGGTHLVEIGGSTAGNGNGFHDQTISAGAVTLNGGTLQGFTTFSGSTGFNPAFGTKINFLQGSSITGSYTTLDFSANNTGKSWILEYRNTEANLFAVPADWGRDLAGMNTNQRNLGKALQSFRVDSIDHRRPLTDRETIFNGLMRLDNESLKNAYHEMSPESLITLSESIKGLGSFAAGATDQRFHQIRRGDRGVSLNGLSLRTLDGDFDYEPVAIKNGDQGIIPFRKKKGDQKYGFFLNTSGSYRETENDPDRIGSENRLGSVTIGIDREITPETSIGLFASQGYANTLLISNGTLESHSGRIGFYTGYHQKGLYVNTNLSLGTTAFESERHLSFIGQRAKGSTQGYDLFGQINAGCDFQTNSWVWGPMAQVNCGSQWIEAMNETGSAARLHLDSQNQTQLETGLGLRLSRPFQYQGKIWIPELKFLGSYQWIDSNKINARFAAGGDPFSVRVEKKATASFIPGMGLNLILNEQNSIHLNYQSQISSHELSHQTDLAWNIKF